MSVPVGVVMRRAAELAASRLGGEPVSREARGEVERLSVGDVPRSRALRPRTCAYCPGRALHGHITCHAHSDLIALDPFFNPDVPQREEPAEDFRPEALPDRLQRAGG